MSDRLLESIGTGERAAARTLGMNAKALRTLMVMICELNDVLI
jgi:hypothetical protein